MDYSKIYAVVTGAFGAAPAPSAPPDRPSAVSKWFSYFTTPLPWMRDIRVLPTITNAAPAPNDRGYVLQVATNTITKEAAGRTMYEVHFGNTDPLNRTRVETTAMVIASEGSETTFTDVQKSFATVAPNMTRVRSDPLASIIASVQDGHPTYEGLYIRILGLATYFARLDPTLPAGAACPGVAWANQAQCRATWPRGTVGNDGDYAAFCNDMSTATGGAADFVVLASFGVPIPITPGGLRILATVAQANLGITANPAGNIAGPGHYFPDPLGIYVIGGEPRRPADPHTAVVNWQDFISAIRWVHVATKDDAGFHSAVTWLAALCRFVGPEVTIMGQSARTRFHDVGPGVDVAFQILEFMARNVGAAAYPPDQCLRLWGLLEGAGWVAAGAPVPAVGGWRAPPAAVAVIADVILRRAVNCIIEKGDVSGVYDAFTTRELDVLINAFIANSPHNLIFAAGAAATVAPRGWTESGGAYARMRLKLDNTVPAIGVEGRFRVPTCPGLTRLRQLMNANQAHTQVRSNVPIVLLATTASSFMGRLLMMACSIRAAADSVHYATKSSRAVIRAGRGDFNTGDADLDMVLASLGRTASYSPEALLVHTVGAMTAYLGMVTFTNLKTRHHAVDYSIRDDAHPRMIDIVLPPQLSQVLLGIRTTPGGFWYDGSALSAQAMKLPTGNRITHAVAEELMVTDLIGMYDQGASFTGITFVPGIKLTYDLPDVNQREQRSFEFPEFSGTRTSDFTPLDYDHVVNRVGWLGMEFEEELIITSIARSTLRYGARTSPNGRVLNTASAGGYMVQPDYGYGYGPMPGWGQVSGKQAKMEKAISKTSLYAGVRNSRTLAALQDAQAESKRVFRVAVMGTGVIDYMTPFDVFAKQSPIITGASGDYKALWAREGNLPRSVLAFMGSDAVVDPTPPNPGPGVQAPAAERAPGVVRPVQGHNDPPLNPGRLEAALEAGDDAASAGQDFRE